MLSKTFFLNSEFMDKEYMILKFIFFIDENNNQTNEKNKLFNTNKVYHKRKKKYPVYEKNDWRLNEFVFIFVCFFFVVYKLKALDIK